MEHSFRPLLPPEDTSFKPSHYPRTYRVATGWKWLTVIFSIVIIGFGGFCIIYLAHEFPGRSAEAELFLMALSAAFVVAGAYAIAWVIKSRIILLSDAVELYEYFRVKKIKRDEISGFRTLTLQHGLSVLILEPNNSLTKKIKLSSSYERDPEFYRWVKSLPDLDQVDEIAEKSVIAEDESLGVTPEERLARLDWAKRIGKVLNYVSIGLSLGLLFFYQRSGIALIALMAVIPLIAFSLAIRHPKLYSLEDTRNKELRANLVSPLFLPTLTIAIGVMGKYHLVDWRPVAYLALAGVVLVALAAPQLISATKKKKTTAILLALLFGAPYAYGVGLEANGLLDQSSSQKYDVPVLGKHIVSGKHRSWKLTLAAWGPESEGYDVSVPSMLYNEITLGELVCVDLHAGYMHIPWYTVHRCEASTNTH